MKQCQFVKVDRCTMRDGDWVICLSNGEVLCYGGFWSPEWHRLSDKSKVVTDFSERTHKKHPEFPEGTLVYKMGDNYELAELEKKSPTLTIVKVSKHEIPAYCGIIGKLDLSYSSFNKRRFTDNHTAGKRIIVNLCFDDGSKASIDALDDPIWLDADVDMKVEHFSFKSLHIYNLL